ncbi:hypothetical protein LguiA_027178 [Lonicera macranthoides]
MPLISFQIGKLRASVPAIVSIPPKHPTNKHLNERSSIFVSPLLWVFYFN